MGVCIYFFTQDKLAKEEHNSAMNLNKINTQWRTVLREVKTRELHKDIEILSQTFERVVDCKDSVIKASSLPKHLNMAGLISPFNRMGLLLTDLKACTRYRL